MFQSILFHFYGKISIPEEIDFRKRKKQCCAQMNQFYNAFDSNWAQFKRFGSYKQQIIQPLDAVNCVWAVNMHINLAFIQLKLFSFSCQ